MQRPPSAWLLLPLFGSCVACHQAPRDQGVTIVLDDPLPARPARYEVVVDVPDGPPTPRHAVVAQAAEPGFSFSE